MFLRRRGRGFTLIELLVVVSIISLLVSMLLPVLGRAKESAKNVLCLNIIRGLGVCYRFYSEDYNSGIPPLIRGSTQYASTEWYTVLKKYGQRVFEDTWYNADHSDGWVGCPKFRSTYGSYSQNDNIGFKDFLGQKNSWPVKFDQIKSMATVELMCEHANLLHNSAVMYFLGKDIPGVNDAHYFYFPSAHYGYQNWRKRWVEGNGSFLFCDGHVKTIAWDANWLNLDNLDPDHP